jgi:hypothetical protein
MVFFDKHNLVIFSDIVNSHLIQSPNFNGFTLNLYTYSELFPNPEKQITYFSKLMTKINESCLGNIGPEYRNSLSKEFRKLNPNFELAILTNQKITDVSNPTNTFKQIGIPIAILIVEKGECAKHPNMYTINLICSHLGKGKYMMALYCFICKEKGQQFGLLELANAYLNPGGLCLYQKFGFKYDPLLYTQNQDFCFSDFHNLPMKLDFSQYDNPNTAINILMDFEKRFKKDNICLLRDKVSQTAYGILLNLHRFILVGNFENNGKLHTFTDAEGNHYKYNDVLTHLTSQGIDLENMLHVFDTSILAKSTPPMDIIVDIIKHGYTPAMPITETPPKRQTRSSNTQTLTKKSGGKKRKRNKTKKTLKKKHF